MTRISSQALLLLAFLVTMFGLHRFLTFPYLTDLHAWDTEQAGFFAVGLLSDIWVSFLVTVVFVFMDFIIRRARPRPYSRQNILPVVLFAVVGGLAAIHQPYVEFFHFQFVPFHFSYLWDKNFIEANASSVVNLRALMLCAMVCGLSVFLYKIEGTERPMKTALAIFAGLTLTALGAHTANIHYRVQLFVPQELQINALERLYYQLNSKSNPDPLDAMEMDLPKGRLGEDPSLLNLIRPPIKRFSPSKLLADLKLAAGDAMERGDKPLLLTVLLESARPADFGAYNLDEPSITPEFDALAKKGVLFAEAYSTGTVTRGGQEAVWCGYLGAIYSSMMRGGDLTALDDRQPAEAVKTNVRMCDIRLADPFRVFNINHPVRAHVSIEDHGAACRSRVVCGGRKIGGGCMVRGGRPIGCHGSVCGGRVVCCNRMVGRSRMARGSRVVCGNRRGGVEGTRHHPDRLQGLRMQDPITCNGLE